MAGNKYNMYISGKWVDATGGGTFEDMNPYTGEIYAHIPKGKREDTRLAIEAAQATSASSSAASRSIPTGS